MTDNEESPVGQVEAATDEQVAEWKRIATEDRDGPTDDAILALIARCRTERDRADEMTKSWRTEVRIADANERENESLRTENTELRELLGRADYYLEETSDDADVRQKWPEKSGDIDNLRAAIEKKLSNSKEQK